MGNSEPTSGSLVGDISNNLSQIIRHLLPGILIFCTTHIAHPSWFVRMDLTLWTHVAIAAVVSVAAGNVAFVINRYVVHQAIDYIAYQINSEGPARGDTWGLYLRHLGEHIVRAHQISNSSVSKHIIFRTSSILFLYCIAEVVLVFSFWHEASSAFSEFKGILRTVGALVFFAAIVQHFIARKIDHLGILEKKT